MNGINHAGSLCMLSDSPNNVSFYHSQGVSHSTTVTGMDVRMYSGWLVGNSRPDICSLCSSSLGGCLSLVYGVVDGGQLLGPVSLNQGSPGRGRFRGNREQTIGKDTYNKGGGDSRGSTRLFLCAICIYAPFRLEC